MYVCMYVVGGERMEPCCKLFWAGVKNVKNCDQKNRQSTRFRHKKTAQLWKPRDFSLGFLSREEKKGLDPGGDP